MVVKEGRIVEAHAEKGEETLRAAISVDEGPPTSGRWPWCPTTAPSPTRGSSFTNTLFDENASCHLAFGEGTTSAWEGGADMTKEELKALGLNDSITHVDFMVGTEDLSIVGTTRDGRRSPSLWTELRVLSKAIPLRGAGSAPRGIWLLILDNFLIIS